MTPIVTICIPVAPYHVHTLPRALASVRAQTTPCETLVYYDDQQLGAGAARNWLIAHCLTEFLVFLDADDELMPDFTAKTLALFQRSQRYVYSDYLQGDGTRWKTPDCVYAEHERMHLITTLLPTAWARAVNGFNEQMHADEDSEFYIHLNSTGHCGVRLPEPLVIYHIDGQRSGSVAEREARQAVFHTQMRRLYRGKWMGCCSDAPPANQAVIGEKVLVRPTWGMGTRSVVGHGSGVRYPQVDSSNTLEIDRRDLQAQPHLWEVVPPEPVNVAPTDEGSDTFAELAQFARRGLRLPVKPVLKPFVAPPAPVAETKPDVARVLRLAQRVTAKEAYPPVTSNDGGWHETLDGLTQVYTPRVQTQVRRTREVTFVFPDRDYASYTDVRRLVELSGFEMTSQSGIDWDDPPTPLIILSPEQPVQVVRGRSDKLIWWALEYGGEYEADLSNWRGEVWACDPTWAAQNNAKFVVMGSHPDLAEPFNATAEKTFDFLMLAYMTERRQRLQRQLADLASPAEAYPGYGAERTRQLAQSRLMLHAHQRDDTHAIAPQRIALCAAYKLPLIHEAVPDADTYGDWIPFRDYDRLADELRIQIAIYDDGLPQARAEMLHQWLCVENTFRMSVEDALK